MKIKICDTEVTICALDHNNFKYSFEESDNEVEVISYLKAEKPAILERLNYEFEERISIMVESCIPEKWAIVLSTLPYMARPENFSYEVWKQFLRDLDHILKNWFTENEPGSNINKNIHHLMEYIKTFKE